MDDKKVLVCPPMFYDVRYSINPWMMGESVDKVLASSQWQKMKNTLESLGARTTLIDPRQHLPDMIFTANAGTVRGDQVVLSNFRHRERMLEREEFDRWFQEKGYTTHILPDTVYFEGCGDTVVTGDRMLAGYGFRSDRRALEMTAEILDLELVSIKLKDPRFYHLDTCFCLLRADLAIYHPAAFSRYSAAKLKGIELIPVCEEDALRFACNSIVYKDNVLMPGGCERTAETLQARGFNVILIDTSEFLKSGGSLQCMTLWV